MIIKLLLPAGLAFIMFAIGLTLHLSDFSRVFRRPTTIALGLFCQLALLPALAFALLVFYRPEPMLAIGVMILAASPGGITSNLLTHFARGDTALSISLTAISSLAGVMTIPLIVGGSFIWFNDTTTPTDLSVWRLIIGVFTITTLPVLAGIIINHLNPQLAAIIEARARPLSVAVFVAIVIAAFYGQWTQMMTALPVIGLLMLALNITIMTIGFALAMLVGTGIPAAKAISLEGGLQNGAMGIFVATTLAPNAMLAVPSITYALIMNASAALFIIASRFKISTAFNPD